MKNSFLRFALVVLVGFTAVLFYFNESPTQFFSRFRAGTSAQHPAPTASLPAPSSTPSPTPTLALNTPPPPVSTPTPTQIATPMPTPDAMSWLQESKEHWPAQVALRVPVEFPIIIQGQKVGAIRLPAGTSVKLIEVDAKETVLEYQSGRTSVPIEDSDLLARAQASMAKAAAVQ